MTEAQKTPTPRVVDFGSSCESTQQACPVWPIPERVLAFASRPWVDKTLAVLASIPACMEGYNYYRRGLLDIPRALFFAQAALFVLTMLIRRKPMRVSANPWFWIVAWINSNYILLTAAFLGGGVRVASPGLINFLAIIGIWISILARLSLGRNIALVAAQREIVTSGAYRYVRHPIYSAYFVSAISWALTWFSLINTLVIASGCIMLVVRTLMEESFLSQDPEYAAYMKRVRWRWFPGLV